MNSYFNFLEGKLYDTFRTNLYEWPFGNLDFCVYFLSKRFPPKILSEMLLVTFEFPLKVQLYLHMASQARVVGAEG